MDSDRQKRLRPRVDIRIEGQLVDSTGRTMAVTLIDVSATGVRLICEDDLRPGERLMLLADRHGEQPLEIVWVSGHEAGAIFLGSSPLS